MSLTRHLKDAASPVRLFFDEHLANTSAVVAEWNDELRRERLPDAPLPEGVEGSDRALAGVAVEYLIAASVDPALLSGENVCVRGARRVDGIAQLGGRAVEVVAELVPGLADAAAEGPSAPRAWERAAAHACALARFEQAFRSKAVAEATAPTLGGNATLDGLIDELAPTRTVDDLMRLAETAVEDHGWLRDCRALAFKPDFELSRQLGGADADLIADGLLIDFKSTAADRVVKREDVWQVIGYALADASDSFGIARVGISALRWRSQAVFPVEQVLQELSGRSASLEEWRDDFEALLAGLPRPARLRRTA